MHPVAGELYKQAAVCAIQKVFTNFIVTVYAFLKIYTNRE